jgi:hypothetical protein
VGRGHALKRRRRSPKRSGALRRNRVVPRKYGSIPRQGAAATVASTVADWCTVGAMSAGDSDGDFSLRLPKHGITFPEAWSSSTPERGGCAARASRDRGPPALYDR